jgi:hypothetical protein
MVILQLISLLAFVCIVIGTPVGIALLGSVLFRMRKADPESRAELVGLFNMLLCWRLWQYVKERRFESSPSEAFKRLCRRALGTVRVVSWAWIVFGVTFIPAALLTSD